MKYVAVVTFGCILVLSSASAQKSKPAKPAAATKSGPALTTTKDRLSYLIGFDVGGKLLNDFKQRGVEVSNDVFLRGMADALKGNKSVLPDSIAQAVSSAFQKEMMDKQQEAMMIAAAKNKAEGEAFLAANKTKDSVVTLPSGLQYKILSAGTGKSPLATDTVVTNYRGTLIDGTEFDNSYSRGEPATFPVNGVIKGWTEALQLMKEGAKWQLFIPSSIAYGDRGAGQRIGPGATLIFEVELIKVK
jgi:FKBP-type peptidyl-prolyl cis-trans isomerase FklB